MGANEMNQEEVIHQLTAGQIVSLILWVCGAIAAVGAAVAVIVKAVTAAKSPWKKLEQRVEVMEKKLEQHSGYFANDKTRMDIMDEGSRVTQKAILAILSHAIDGNNVEGLKKAKDELQNYLIER